MKKLIIISILGFFCLKVSAQGTVNGHEYVDLGLSVKWATCNVGADSPEEYGTYFDYDNALAVPKSWGENFRLPTNNEFYELINSCTWTWIKQNVWMVIKLPVLMVVASFCLLPAIIKHCNLMKNY